jgi:predicted transcriptional regulator of viral defense system
MSDHVVINSEPLKIGGEKVRIKATGFRYTSETAMDFVSVQVTTLKLGIDLCLYLSPSECGALAERLLAVKAGIEDATGEGA